MFSKLYKNSPVKNILVITLSNIGDVVLTAPVMDILLRDFPAAKLSLIVGAKAASLFEGNPRIERNHIFDKKLDFWQRIQWTLSLRRYHYDLVVDLRNSMIGYFLFPRWMMSPASWVNPKIHYKERHLSRLRMLYDYISHPISSLLAIAPSQSDEICVDQLLKFFLDARGDFVVIAPNASNLSKAWSREEFIKLSNNIVDKYSLKIVLIGAAVDREKNEYIVSHCRVPILNLVGKTNLIQTAALIRRAKILVTNDSGPMHLASYFNKPIIALFGPTDPSLYGPWSSLFKVVRKNDDCPYCADSKSEIPHNCMENLTQEDVFNAFQEVYEKI